MSILILAGVTDRSHFITSFVKSSRVDPGLANARPMGSGKFANGTCPIVTQGKGGGGGGGGGWCKGLGTAGIDRCIMHDHYGDNMLLTKETVHFTMLQFTASLLLGQICSIFLHAPQEG